MSRHLCLAGLILFGLGLSGCKTITIDESFVFQPGQFGDPNETRLTTLKYENIFAVPTDLTIDVWADGQTAQHHIKSSDFVKTNLTHESLDNSGKRLAITWIERDGPARPLVLHCGGNASDRYESGVLYAQKMISFADVLLFDYPGYGDSAGRADAESLRAANQALADYINTEVKPARNLILWGHSLGGFVCADMVKRLNEVDGLILEATATNAQDVSQAVMPWYAKFFIRARTAESLDAYDMVETLKTVDAPILILGAAKDKTLPVALSRKLSMDLKAVGRDVTYAEFPNANHISIPTQDTFRGTVEGFVESLGSVQISQAGEEMSGLKP
jgi:pimeloyl-ACP methyl ester carboxylesterase